ncbi:MAG: transposase [Lysobacterales bacterium]|nr:MAG: transposase [Xanthomonadales bacterium]
MHSVCTVEELMNDGWRVQPMPTMKAAYGTRDKAFVNSMSISVYDELLNRELFLSLAEARWVVDRWRLDYNHRRPHSSLDYQTPAAFAANWPG